MPRRPRKLTDAEYRVIKLLLLYGMVNDRITSKLTDEDYQAGLDLVTHVRSGAGLYKLTEGK